MNNGIIEEIKSKIWQIVNEVGNILGVSECVGSCRIVVEIDNLLEVGYLVYLEEGCVSEFSVERVCLCGSILFKNGKWMEHELEVVCKNDMWIECIRDLEPKVTKITIVEKFSW
jgi:hypothetical protein